MVIIFISDPVSPENISANDSFGEVTIIKSVTINNSEMDLTLAGQSPNYKAAGIYNKNIIYFLTIKLTLILLETKVINLCHHYKARPDAHPYSVTRLHTVG